MYEYIEKSIGSLKKKAQSTFNNSRLSLLKFDEISLLQVKNESNSLYKKLKRQSEAFFLALIHELATDMNFNENEYSLEHFLTSFSPVLLYTFETETERKQAKHFEMIASIGGSKSPRVLEEQKKEIRYWMMQVEETAVDIEREIFLKEARKRGVKKVKWLTKHDGKVCKDCADLNGKIFEIENIPRRPHIGCRCWLKEV